MHRIHPNVTAEHIRTAASNPNSPVQQKAATAIGNHVRWHERRGIVRDGCPLCESATTP
jgi:hypothetical protein